jgi:hypothetical protein
LFPGINNEISLASRTGRHVDDKAARARELATAEHVAADLGMASPAYRR